MFVNARYFSNRGRMTNILSSRAIGSVCGRGKGQDPKSLFSKFTPIIMTNELPSVGLGTSRPQVPQGHPREVLVLWPVPLFIAHASARSGGTARPCPRAHVLEQGPRTRSHCCNSSCLSAGQRKKKETPGLPSEALSPLWAQFHRWTAPLCSCPPSFPHSDPSHTLARTGLCLIQTTSFLPSP